MNRCILHVDLNSCYASIECMHRPYLRGKSVAVGGDVEKRHGIILAKNEKAKAAGVKTAEAIWQARQKCPDLVIVKPDFNLYMRISRLFGKILCDYSDKVESFGIDERWCDVTGSLHLFGGEGEKLADSIRARIKNELGITASIGVSFNKVFAKLGSDYKKPDATTVISRDNFQDIVWPLPCEDLLYVGSATKRKLNRIGVFTIGDLAQIDPSILKSILGKWGYMLSGFANGEDATEVSYSGEENIIKSIGNSCTTPRDLENIDDVSLTMYVLCESVAMRLVENGLEAGTISISLRNVKLNTFERQVTLSSPTLLSQTIHDEAMKLIADNYNFEKPLRSVGVRASMLRSSGACRQLSIMEDNEKLANMKILEETVFNLRDRYEDNRCIKRAVLIKDKIGEIDTKEDNTIHPVSFIKSSI